MFFKKLITTKRETEVLDSAIETWIVEWTQRYGSFSDNTKQAFQAFLSKEDADKFADSLRQAFKLIGQTSGNKVSVYKNDNGL
jgi:hypothetical protein